MSELVDRNQTDDLESQIRGIIAEVSGRKIESDSDGLQYLGLDSLESLEIMTVLENRFGVTLSEEIVRQFTSVSSIARIILRTRNARQENWHPSVR